MCFLIVTEAIRTFEGSGMDKTTLAALKGSIKKWKLIESGKGEDLGTENCPLCAEFYGDFCYGCPVRERTGTHSCNGSPYEEWSEFEVDRAETDEEKQAAKDMRVFLESLLPVRRNSQSARK